MLTLDHDNSVAFLKYLKYVLKIFKSAGIKTVMSHRFVSFYNIECKGYNRTGNFLNNLYISLRDSVFRPNEQTIKAYTPEGKRILKYIGSLIDNICKTRLGDTFRVIYVVEDFINMIATLEETKFENVSINIMKSEIINQYILNIYVGEALQYSTNSEFNMTVLSNPFIEYYRDAVNYCNLSDCGYMYELNKLEAISLFETGSPVVLDLKKSNSEDVKKFCISPNFFIKQMYKEKDDNTFSIKIMFKPYINDPNTCRFETHCFFDIFTGGVFGQGIFM